MLKDGEIDNMKKKTHNRMLKTIVLLLTCSFFMQMEQVVFAGEINSDEARLISAASSTFTHDGKEYRAKKNYVNSLKSYLSSDDVDLTAEQVDEAIATMYASVEQGIQDGYLYEIKDENTASETEVSTTEATTTEEVKEAVTEVIIHNVTEEYTENTTGITTETGISTQESIKFPSIEYPGDERQHSNHVSTWMLIFTLTVGLIGFITYMTRRFGWHKRQNNVNISIMTDIHCHILPAVDDGARDNEMAIKMINIAYNQGIRKMILTPHYSLERQQYSVTKLEKIYEAFKETIEKTYPEVQLYLGNEIYYTKGALEALKAGQICTMAGTKYVLLEFSPGISYRELYGAVREFVQSRYRPIIAHVERYRCLIKQQHRIIEITQSGAYLQMNAESVDGSILDAQVRWCRQLLLKGYISFVATDAHDLEKRAPYIESAVSWMIKKMENEKVEQLLFGNAELLLQNKYLE